MANTAQIPSVTLNNGLTMPQIGFGLYQIDDKQECIEAIGVALESGYRHFDSAQYYENEGYLGEALKTAHIDRGDIFATTKISYENMQQGSVRPSYEQSLDTFGFDYFDLLLLHFPVSGARQAAWREMQDILEAGQAKSIGVSNYTIKHLEELMATSDIVPAVNQVELHVFLQQAELREFCQDKGIVVQAYSPLAQGQGMDHSTLAAIGTKYAKTPAQIMVRWCIEAGTVPLPKSVTPERIAANIEVFDFTFDDNDRAQLKALDTGRRVAWDPSDVA